MSVSSSALAIIPVLLSIVSLYLVYRIYRYDYHYISKGRSTLWKIILIVISLAFIERITALLIETGGLQMILLALGYGEIALESIRPLQVADRIVTPLIVDAFLILLFWTIVRDGKPRLKSRKWS